ncbi:ClpP/crotonase-like domain-containing protein, partial [Baffinella frigidus]
VTLNRGGKLNALDLPMFRQLAATARELISDKSVRWCGRWWCAGRGAASSVAHPLRARENAAELLHRPEGAVSNLAQQDVAFLWRKVPAPVIAVTHGVCFGGGLQIALGADMRVTSPTCRFSVMEAKWGIIPDMSLTVTIRELVPKDVALELVMTGRVFEAEEALKLGLVTRIADVNPQP